MNMRRFIPTFRKLGWTYSADALGEYFQRGQRRISVMHTGPLFTCFVNDVVAGTFRTVGSCSNLTSPDQVARWMMTYAV